MKTLRDLLLERHRDAQPQLDALRRAFVDSFAVPASRSRSATPAPACSFGRLVWEELVVRARATWTLLAAGALAALLLNASCGAFSDEPPRPPSTASVDEIRAERAALLAELRESAPNPPPSTPPAPSVGPRRSSLRSPASTAISA